MKLRGFISAVALLIGIDLQTHLKMNLGKVWWKKIIAKKTLIIGGLLM